MLNDALVRMLHLKPHQLAAFDRLLGEPVGTWESIANEITPVFAGQAVNTIENKVPVVGTVDGLADLVTSSAPSPAAIAQVSAPATTPAPAPITRGISASPAPPTTPALAPVAVPSDVTSGTPPVTISTANPATASGF